MDNEPKPTIGEPQPGGPQALDRLVKDIPEILDYIGCYLRARWDLAKWSLKNFLVVLFLSILVLTMVVSIAVTGAIFFFYGLSQGLSQWIGGPAWSGFLLSGAFLVFAIVIFIPIYLARMRKTSLKKCVEEYEASIEKQRAKYGRSVFDQGTTT